MEPEHFPRLEFDPFRIQTQMPGSANQMHLPSASSEDGNGAFGDLNLDDPLMMRAMDEWSVSYLMGSTFKRKKIY
jgi:hypothetical protein